MKNATRTRLKMAVSVIVFLAVITVWAITKEMEGVASAGIAGILTVATLYIGSEGYRPSNKPPTP